MLNEEELRRLYLEEKLTETEIGKLSGLSQRQVNIRRQKWGIPIISKSDRFNLPPLSQKQKSLLLGSLFGDAGLFPTGSKTAALSEYHSDHQAEYLQWKADIWGPYVCSISKNTSVKEGKEFRGQILRTFASKEFRPYWQLAYPEGKGDKVFYNLDLTDFDALSLAVWYLDDGGKVSNGYVNFSVTPDRLSQEVEMGLLRRFGLTPVLHDFGGDSSIWLHDRDSMSKFIDLVGEYLPESMNYKLNLVPRSRGESPRSILTEETLREYTTNRRSLDWIVQATGTSGTSVRRALDLYGLTLTPVELSWGDVKDKIQSGVSNEELVDLLVGLDMPEPPTVEDAKRDFDNLCKRTLATIGDGVISGGGRVGLATCDSVFQHRYSATKDDRPSLKKAWFDPIWVGKAVEFQRKQGDPLYPRNVFRALKALIRSPSNFRPPVAKKLVEDFSPEGGLVFDPCAGYGGRAVGTLAAGRNYIGVDPHPKAETSFRLLGEMLDKSLTFHNQPFEEFSQDVQADLILTSPPYFSAERYSNDPKQSWVRYPTWSMWVEKFLKTLIFKSFNCLKPGGRMLLNVTDSVIKGRSIPLIQTSLDLALEAGFIHEGTLQMLLGTLGQTRKFEPILVFLKTGGTCIVPPVVIPKGQIIRDSYNTGTGLTKELLCKHYQTELLTDAEIAKIYKVSDVLVSQQRKLHGISTITPRQRADLLRGGPILEDLTPELLAKLRGSFSQAAIGAQYGVSKMPIRKLCLKWGIP